MDTHPQHKPISKMTERWQQIENLFDGALEQPLEIRREWLEKACSDTAIVAEVMALLEANTEAEGFLDRPAEQFAADLIQSEVADQIGQLGPYRVVKEIGRGGMGAVFLAERTDGHYEKRVAVKMLRPGIASDHHAERFVAERQILATLNHPNIARLVDGGVSALGTPYFVMDYIDGRPIDVYCTEKGLSIDDRLQLFLVACQTVSYAHRQLVVHRDLKPSNILVTDEGAVKLLDFGIAKLMEPETQLGPAMVTNTGHFLMTPEYASPEQVRGNPISIASDVYQLGLLLYKLLTGVLPHRFSNRSLTDIARVVCEEEPTRPSDLIDDGGGIAPDSMPRSRLEKRLSGDLDAIVMKTLRKEPEERYESVDRLAEDVANHLRGLPVAAHSGSRVYRIRKFVRRNKWQVAAAFLFAMLFAGYAATVTIQQDRMERERDRATQYATFLTDLFSSPNPFQNRANTAAREITVREFLDTGVDRLRSQLEGDDAVRASLFETIADVYEGLGYPLKARELYQELVSFSTERYGRRSPETLKALRLLSGVTTDPVRADSLFGIQLALARDLEGSTGPLTAQSLTIYGRWLANNGRMEDGAAALDEAVLTLRSAGPDHREALIGALLFSAQVQKMMNRISEADTLASEAYQLRRAVSGDDHPGTAVIMMELAINAEAAGDMERAERLKRHILEVFRKSLGEHHTYTLGAANNLGVLLEKTGRLEEAEALARETVALRERYFGSDHPETIRSLQNLAVYLLRQGRLEEAAPLFEETHARYEASLPVDNYETALPLLSLTDVYLQLNQLENAESSARAARDHFMRVLPDDHHLTAIAWSRLGESLTRQGRFSEAEPLLLNAYKVLLNKQGFDSHRERTRVRLVTLYTLWNRAEDAARFAP